MKGVAYLLLLGAHNTGGEVQCRTNGTVHTQNADTKSSGEDQSGCPYIQLVPIIISTALLYVLPLA